MAGRESKMDDHFDFKLMKKPKWMIFIVDGVESGRFREWTREGVKVDGPFNRPLPTHFHNKMNGSALSKLTIRRRSSLVKVLTTIVSRTVFENFLHLGIKSKIVSIFFEWSNINDFMCSILVIEAFKPVPKIKINGRTRKGLMSHVI